MPIVFIHGVNSRKTESGYQARQELIAYLAARHLIGATVNGKTVVDAKTTFPYWGDLATTFAWDMASLPSAEIDSLGAVVDADLRPLVGAIREELGELSAAAAAPLLRVAQKSLPQAVGVLTDAILQVTPSADAKQMAAFIASAQAYAEANPHPLWVSEITTDAQFVNRLATESTSTDACADQALGVAATVVGAISAAALRLRVAVATVANTALDHAGDFASTKLVAWQRRSLNATLGRFFGDVFVYLDTRGDAAAPGNIPSLIIHDLNSAASRAPNEPLILIAHSLGGVICFDLLSSFAVAPMIDLFVTVGSQVSHFEEMKRFKGSDATIPSQTTPRAPTPGNIRHWINVFDEIDIFAYACNNVFDRVLDFRYDTRTHFGRAHSAYLYQDRFFNRLRTRIDTLS